MKTLKVSDEVYKTLMDMKIILEAKFARPVSFDGVIRHLINATMTHPDIEYRSAVLNESMGIEVVRNDERTSRRRRAPSRP
jgi:hypothetical protein